MAPQQQKLTPEDLRSLLVLLPLLDKEREEFQAKINQQPDKFVEKFLTTGFIWAPLYEVPFPQLLVRFITVAGLDKLAKGMSVKAMLALVDGLEDTEWAGGGDGSVKPGDLVGYLHAVAGNLDCLLIYGSYLCDLLALARTGDMTALLNSIRIDPSVVSGPTASLFISISVVEGDKEFLRKVGGAMLGKTGKQAAYLKKFRLLMQILHETGELGRPTKEIMELAFSVGAYNRSPGAEKNVSELIRKARALKKNTISK